MRVQKSNLDKISLEKTKAAYKRYAPFYDVVFGMILNAGRRRAIRKLGCRKGDHVLEIGVGTGLALPMYPNRVQVTGIDICTEMLCKAKARTASGNICCMDAENMGFADNTFDKVVAMYVITAVPDAAAVIKEAVRVCKPGGEILLYGHFQSHHRVINWVEKLLTKVSDQIGFKPNLGLKDVLDVCPKDFTQVNSHGLLNHWTMIYFYNNKQVDEQSAIKRVQGM